MLRLFDILLNQFTDSISFGIFSNFYIESARSFPENFGTFEKIFLFVGDSLGFISLYCVIYFVISYSRKIFKKASFEKKECRAAEMKYLILFSPILLSTMAAAYFVFMMNFLHIHRIKAVMLLIFIRALAACFMLYA